MNIRFFSSASLILGFAFSPSVWAINKCTDASGKVSYQEQPCEGRGSELKIRQQGAPAPAPAPVPEKKPVTAASPVPPAAVVPPPPVNAPKTELELQANQCLGYYKPKLRDPAGAYFSDTNMDKSVLTMKMHATNGFGGYVTREIKCEFKQNGELDTDWTKIHAQRIGW